MAYAFGMVKAVLSGDTMIIMGSSKSGPPPEVQVTLSSLQCPRASRHPQADDEPWGWPAREFLRKLAIGKQVKFQIEYRKETAGGHRDFASVHVADPKAAGGYSENLCLTVVRAGWAKVAGEAGSRAGKSKVYEQLQALEEEAKAAGVGMHNPDAGAAAASMRPLIWNAPDGAALAADLKGTPQPAIIEQVRDGGSFRCLLLNSMTVTSFSLAGLQCPRVGRTASSSTSASSGSAAGSGSGSGSGAASAASIAAGGASAAGKSSAPSTGPAPFAAEAKHFVEVRLLHRDVTLVVGGADKYGNLFGSVQHPAGNIATELLKRGFARMVDWSLGFASMEDVSVMRAAERTAKDGRMRLWKDYVPRVITGDRVYKGVVVEISSGDTLVVLVRRGSTTEERRVSLSSIRAPRMGNPRRRDPPAPFALQAKEWLRRSVIGREVDVTVDYIRSAAPAASSSDAGAGAGSSRPAQDRTYATVLLTTRKGAQTNLGLSLVALGLAEVIRHRKDEDRSPDWDVLFAAETKSKEDKKGLHNPKAPAEKHVVDLTGDATKAKSFMSYLQRDGVVGGVVEHVFSGSRFKVFVPKQNCEMMFALAAVRCPNTGRAPSKDSDGKTRPGRTAEPYGAEALAFARELLNQRDVEVQVETMDKNGTGIGPMWIGKGGQRRNVPCELLRRGFASVFKPAADRSNNADELYAAEAEAKAAKRGVWESYTETVVAEAKAEAGEEFVKVKVCEIIDGASFFAHAEKDLGRVATVEGALAELMAEVGPTHAPCEPKKNKLVASMFKEGPDAEPKWFRARIEGRVRDEEAGEDLWKITYVDYGNREDVPVTRLRPLPGSLTTVPPLARECQLAFIKVPQAGEEFFRDAAIGFSELVWGATVVAKVHARDEKNRLMVTLYEESRPASINELLVTDGVARVSKNELRRVNRRAERGLKGASADKTLMDSLVAAQNQARAARRQMWTLGDVADSDDEERLK